MNDFSQEIFFEEHIVPLMKSRSYESIAERIPGPNEQNIRQLICDWCIHQYDFEGLQFFYRPSTPCLGKLLWESDWIKKWEVALWLVDAGENVNETYTIGKHKYPYIATPALYRWYWKEKPFTLPLQLLETLLKHGADPNVVDAKDMKTPLMYAMEHYNKPAIDLLKKFGATYDFNNAHQNHLLQFAKSIEELYMRRACWKHQRRPASTTLVCHWQAYWRDQMYREYWSKRYELLSDILKSKCVNYINFMCSSSKTLETALHIIAKTTQVRLAKMLMDAGADPNLPSVTIVCFGRSFASKTSLNIAQKERQKQMLSFLNKYSRFQMAKKAWEALAEINLDICFDVAVLIVSKVGYMNEEESRRFAYDMHQKTKHQNCHCAIY
jgi:hypothetical protein